MFLTEQQKRYLTLDGDPVYAHPVLRLATNAGVQAGLATAAFNAAATGYGGGNIVLAFVLSAAGIAAHRYSYRNSKDYVYGRGFGSNHETLAIDKEPDDRTRARGQRYVLSANIVMDTMRPYVRAYAVTAVLLANSAINSLHAMATHGLPGMGPIFYVLSGMYVTMLADTASLMRRFNRVSRQDWAVVDKPTEEVREPKKTPPLRLPALV